MSRYISNALKAKIRQQAKFRCGYCLRSETLIGMPMEFEHIFPIALGGKTNEENLWLSCRRCNEFKGTQTHTIDPETGEKVKIYNPRTQIWNEHFCWSEEGTEIIGNNRKYFNWSRHCKCSEIKRRNNCNNAKSLGKRPLVSAR